MARRNYERARPMRKPVRLVWLHVGALCRIPRSSDPKAVWMVLSHRGTFPWSPVELTSRGCSPCTWRASDLRPILLDSEDPDDDTLEENPEE